MVGCRFRPSKGIRAVVITEQLWGLYGYFLICYTARCAPREAWTRLGRAETSEKARVVSDSIEMRFCHGESIEWLPGQQI